METALTLISVFVAENRIVQRLGTRAGRRTPLELPEVRRVFGRGHLYTVMASQRAVNLLADHDQYIPEEREGSLHSLETAKLFSNSLDCYNYIQNWYTTMCENRADLQCFKEKCEPLFDHFTVLLFTNEGGERLLPRDVQEHYQDRYSISIQRCP
ncbi:hypothetical protein RRG08_027107 [Elysia crispata]|uniref:Uncharacterized protein n=1 Tax=Elysia crispata TaxID=231223 RepID=A0AAE0YY00_9GAST|nr:hypothetical protein RRG08_027107 [Elysia crispata]